MTERERLIDIFSTTIYPRIGADPREVVADFLLDNGVIIPPVKVGDLLYVLYEIPSGSYTMYLADVKEIKCCVSSMIVTKKVVVEPVSFRGRRIEYGFDDFGKLLFFDNREAEAALKECEQK